MSDKLFETAVEYSAGIHFILLSNSRPVEDEIPDLCGRLYKRHLAIALPGQALWVDLRPAFEKPVGDINSLTCFSVPLGYHADLVRG
jgi:hypothetical protein